MSREIRYEINLPADGVLPEVRKRLEDLQAAIGILEGCQEQAPEGALCSSISHGKLQWHCFANGVKKYLPLSSLDSIKALAQKKYVGLVLESLCRQRAALERLLQDYHPDACHEIYATMRLEFQNVATTLFPSSEEIATEWKSVRYRGKSLEGSNLLSVDGIKVRSKSELMIANALSGSGVPYRYEFPYKMKWRGADGVRQVKVFPDFTCLNVRTRQEIVWEHFGMMDESGYAQTAIEKLDAYESNGFLLGKNFVFTMETKALPLDSRKIQTVIKRYLL